MTRIFLLLSVISVTVATNLVPPEVIVGQGVLRGKYEETWRNKPFSSFTGIPYAKPPIGDFRFKPPVSAEAWSGIYDATLSPPMCPQINVYFKNFNIIEGDEDCLYLNIYTPQLPESDTALLPVMVFIHGGGFMNGKSDWYGPNVLLDKDIVLVTINYRVGALGFITTGDEVVPGNNGLKDQNFALKWIQNNIKPFGGDPKRVTLLGNSAGGASTHYHVISPLSKGLIHGAILQSGTAQCCWSYGPTSQGVKNTKILAKHVNCPTDSSEKMVECLTKIDAYELVKQDTKFYEYHYDPMTIYKPVIEPVAEGAFLTEHPIDIIKAGKAANIPIMAGGTSEDGTLKSAGLYDDYNLIKRLNDEFDKLAPILFQYHDTAKDKSYITKRIRDFYFGTRPIDENTKSEVTDVFADSWFLLPTEIAVQLHFKYSKKPVYYYLFSYRGSMSFSLLFGKDSYNYGVSHCDELLYLFQFDQLFKNFIRSEADGKMIDIMTTMWTNFATTGNPTPANNSLFPNKWKPVSSNKLEYYNIKGQGDMEMATQLYKERMEFWKNLPIDSERVLIKDEL